VSSARFLRGLQPVQAPLWDALAGSQPLVRHQFLAAMENSGCLRPEYGWSPYHLLLEEGEQLLAAAPCYIKGNSHGEFVFDWSWAQAYADAGLDYYPKLVVAVPYSPVSGPRLLAPTAALKSSLLDALEQACARSNLSSVHVNFVQEADREALRERGWIERCQVQFHYTRALERNFDEYLARFSSKKRKNIRQERAHVAASGFRFVTLEGAQISDDDLALAHRFYLHTFDEKCNHAALTLAFFSAIRTHLLLIQAQLDGQTVAGAICFRDQTTLYGRYWGTLAGLEDRANLAGLHFETCYYQGIEYVLAAGLSRFEPGAQGEHKQARGFDPTLTYSAHYIKDRRFREPIAQFCRRECEQTRAYAETLAQHSPFKQIA